MRTPAQEVWEIINALKQSNESTRLIADSNDKSIAIYVEVSHSGNDAYINVTEDEESVFFEIIVDEADCIESVERTYSLFLDDEEPSERSLFEEEADEREIEIEDREFNLMEAAEDFIAVLLDGSTHKDAIVTKVFAETLVEAACKSLHRKGVDVYRPMYLKDEETGDIDYFEYPYSEM